MKADRLFLERNCSHCGIVKAVLDMDAVASDDFRGSDGQGFLVFSSQSNGASVELLKKFGLQGRRMPVLVKNDGTVLDKAAPIIQHLKASGMAAK